MQVPPDSALDKNFDLNKFTGRWYITAGLNPLFDVFPCQEHYFGVPKPGEHEGYAGVVKTPRVWCIWRFDTRGGGDAGPSGHVRSHAAEHTVCSAMDMRRKTGSKCTCYNSGSMTPLKIDRIACVQPADMLIMQVAPDGTLKLRCLH